MRKHGWQLPYHPLQVVAVAVFLALGFAFYVFFAPFVGKKAFQYVLVGVYTPLIISAFSLYIWCAAADPADSGVVFKSKKYLQVSDNEKSIRQKDSKLGGESTSSIYDANAAANAKSLDGDAVSRIANESTINAEINNKGMLERSSCLSYVFAPCALISKCCCPSDESSDNQASKDGMFYCSLCEVKVFEYSKHCRVCDKCVDRFDHHCRWLNNCIGRKNYRQFFTLMVFTLLLLILQWSTGIFVLICCFNEKKQFLVDISAKLGSSFSLVPYVIVVAVCTLLAMIATLPLAQLFFFHILLIKKGISTYDYIIALREQDQEQQGVGTHQSAQMSPASSITGLSSVSSFSTLQRGAWCTPPRLFLEDQFDVVPPETASVSSLGKKMETADDPLKKKNSAAVKISPWTLARLNAEEVSRAASEARKKSKTLHPVTKKEPSFGVLETDRSFSGSSRRMVPRPDSNRRRPSKPVRLPADLGMEPLANLPLKTLDEGIVPETSTSLAPLQLEARTAFQTSRAMSSSAEIVGSSPESSLDSLDMPPFRVSLSGPEETRRIAGVSAVAGIAEQRGFPLSRSTSDGSEASGGEDGDRVPSKIFQRPVTMGNWNSPMGFEQDERLVARLRGPSSALATQADPRKP